MQPFRPTPTPAVSLIERDDPCQTIKLSHVRTEQLLAWMTTLDVSDQSPDRNAQGLQLVPGLCEPMNGLSLGPLVSDIVDPRRVVVCHRKQPILEALNCQWLSGGCALSRP